MNVVDPRTRSADRRGAEGAKVRILVVDDVADNREVLTRRLVRRGFDVVEAGGGQEALDLLAGGGVDIMLLDIMMPEVSGVDVLREVRKTRSELELPIIMVSAKSHSEDVVECLEVGANDYVTKPVDFAVALARIHTQLARKSATEAERAESAAALRRTSADLAVETEQRQRSEERLHYLAYHDGLTGLLNRTAFRERLAEKLDALRGTEREVTLFFVDLDRFKAVNDVHGHEAGDKLLGHVATRLRHVLGDGALMARLGGDEFAAVIDDAPTPEEAVFYAQKAVDALDQPFDIGGQRFQLGASCGVAHAADCASDADALLKAADLAMYRAKTAGRDRLVVYEPRMLEEQKERSILEVEFRRAIHEGCLELHYQPLVSARSKQITSFEALLRWPHPERGMISPEVFVPLAEQTGLIVPLGAWVLRSACAEAMTWPSKVRVAVNLSPLQFRDENLLPTIVEVLTATGLDPHRLELEITESALLESGGHNVDILRAIRALGVRVSMDDFGTGYSSMAYLQQFEFDKIKIDRRFVDGLGRGANSAAIIKAIVQLGENIGVDTTAEGVETEEQLAAVTLHGCTELQGFLFSRPLSALDTKAYLARAPRGGAS